MQDALYLDNANLTPNIPRRVLNTLPLSSYRQSECNCKILPLRFKYNASHPSNFKVPCLLTTASLLSLNYSALGQLAVDLLPSALQAMHYTFAVGPVPEYPIPLKSSTSAL